MHGGDFGCGATGQANDSSLRFAASALRHSPRCLRARRARCSLRALRSQRAGYLATLWAFRLGHICWVGICCCEDGGSAFWDNALSTLACIGIFWSDCTNTLWKMYLGNALENASCCQLSRMCAPNRAIEQQQCITVFVYLCVGFSA